MAAKKVKKTSKKTAKPKKDKRSEAASAADAGIGHNNKIPPASEIERCKKRVDALKESKATANAKHMADIKGVYSEYGDKWGMTIGAVRIVLGQAEAQEKFAEMMAEADTKKRDDITRLMAGVATAPAFEGKPAGVWARAQAEVFPLEDDDKVPAPTKATVVKKSITGEPTKTPAQAAQEAFDREDAAATA